MSGNPGRKSIIVGLLCLAVALGTIVAAYLRQRTPRGTETPPVVSTADTTTASSGTDTSAQVQSTGTGKDASTQQAADSKVTSDGAATEAARKLNDQIDYGTTKPVDANTNPQVRSVAEALKNKTHPERLSPLITPKPFDAKAYKEDPKAYLDVVEPGRCFQSAQPGKDVPQLRPLSPQFQNVVQGQFVTLRVQTVPKAPCSFTAFDLGKFQNELTAITVESDEKGVAEAKFYGTPGTINEANVLAASPMASGQARFILNVTK